VRSLRVLPGIPHRLDQVWDELDARDLSSLSTVFTRIGNYRSLPQEPVGPFLSTPSPSSRSSPTAQFEIQKGRTVDERVRFSVAFGTVNGHPCVAKLARGQSSRKKLHIESRFYTTVLTHSSVNVPKFYGLFENREHDESVMLLENVGTVKKTGIVSTTRL
jgi:hypothetical protein